MTGGLRQTLSILLLLASSSCGGRTTPFAIDDASPTTGGSDASGEGGRSSAGSSGNPSGATSGSSGAKSSGGSSNACRTQVALSRSPPVIEFLVDSSLSMKTALTAEVSRWSALQGALRTTFQTLDADISSGLLFYPNVQLSAGPHEGTTWCFLAYAAATIAPLDPVQRQRMLDALATKAPLGATPTQDAYMYALSLLNMAPRAGSRYIVLLTDGAPTYGPECTGSGIDPVDTAPLQSVAAAARADGIRTFVIGLGNEDNDPWLSRLARAGGTERPSCSLNGPPPCHYRVGNVLNPVSALSGALSEVMERAVSCVYELPSEVSATRLESQSAELVYEPTQGDSRRLGRFTSQNECGFGVVHAEAGSRRVELCPALCDELTLDARAKITLSLPCSGSR